jgi:hypothetical protein
MGSNSSFALVQAAEALLEDAKRLAAGSCSDGNDLELRRSIAETGRRIAFETAPPMDVIKSEWVVVCLHHQPTPPHHTKANHP